MYLFKERLKELIGNIFSVAIAASIVCGFIWAVNVIPYADAILGVLLIGGMVLGLAYIFLNWLIIEPFLDSELYWKIRSKLKRK